MIPLEPAKIENYSGFTLKWRGKIPSLRNGYYIIEDRVIDGDAPKDFVRIYEYREGRKHSPKTWPAYIAKVGHKWYPIESITEYLLNRIGETLELEMAHSQLMVAGEQIRFLSRYFLKETEQLVHGAQIFAGFIADKNFVEEVERQKMARDFFTFQFVEAAIKYQFPNHATELLSSFTKLLLFDALVGNNDRHFYNWGIISDVTGKIPPRFSPIYDSARGLFWNVSEQKILELLHDQNLCDHYLKKYIKNSIPKTGWEGQGNINHFKLIELIYENDQRYGEMCRNILNFEKYKAVIDLLEQEFKTLLSKERRFLISECLKLRYEKLQAIIS